MLPCNKGTNLCVGDGTSLGAGLQPTENGALKPSPSSTPASSNKRIVEEVVSRTILSQTGSNMAILKGKKPPPEQDIPHYTYVVHREDGKEQMPQEMLAILYNALLGDAQKPCDESGIRTYIGQRS